MKPTLFTKFGSDLKKGDGLPVVHSRFGFRKVSHDGKKYLEAMTQDDLVSALLKANRLDHAEKVRNLKPADAWCAQRSDGSCYSNNGCGNCQQQPVDPNDPDMGTFCQCMD